MEKVPEQSESEVSVVPMVENSNSLTIDQTANVTKANDQLTKKIATSSQAVKNMNVSQTKAKRNKIKNKTLLLSNTSKISAKKDAPSTSAIKKNSLLQLAAALKTKTKISDSNSRLKQLLNSK